MWRRQLPLARWRARSRRPCASHPAHDAPECDEFCCPSGIAKYAAHSLALQALPEDACPAHAFYSHALASRALVTHGCLSFTLPLLDTPEKQNPPGHYFWRGGIRGAF